MSFDRVVGIALFQYVLLVTGITELDCFFLSFFIIKAIYIYIYLLDSMLKFSQMHTDDVS